MTPIDPIELSAYLDGELTAVRRQEIEEALAADSALCEEFNALARVDAAWRRAAKTAAFKVDVQLPARSVLAKNWLPAATVVTALVAVRLLSNLSDTLAWGFVLNTVALAGVLVWVTRMASEPAALG